MALIICPECNKEISDKVKACPHCGFPLRKDEECNVKGEAISIKKKFVYKQLILICIVMIIVVSSIVTFSNNPVKKYKNELEVFNVEKANNIYYTKIQGNQKAEKEVKVYLESKSNTILYDFINSKIEYKDAVETLYNLNKTSLITTKVEDIKKQVEDLNCSRIAYTTALQFEVSREYAKALEELNKVIETDINYESASAKVIKLSAIYKEQITNKISELATVGNYEEILNLLEKAIIICKDDNDLISKKQEYEKKYTSLVLTVGDKEVYLDEMMYYIYAVEAEGNYYDQMWQQTYGMSYWDAEFSEGITMREQTKQYLIDTVVMYEILHDKAFDTGYTLTDEEKTEAATNADTIMTSITTEQIKVTGFNKAMLTKVQEKLILGEKYYNKIIEGLSINEDEVTADVNKADYKEFGTEATTQYEEAVTKALSDAEQEGFDVAYNTLKEDYPHTVNEKVWNKIIVGETTLVKTE